MTDPTELTPTFQRDSFLESEGDAYFARSQGVHAIPSEITDAIVMHLGEHGSLLEIGCGDCDLLAGLREALGTSWQLAGIDSSPRAVAAARARGLGISAHVGTADDVPLDTVFDAVVLGFFLYVVDRRLLFRVVAEVDRLLAPSSSDGGSRLFIYDFDPPRPQVRPYRHRSGMSSWKMDYSRLFLSNPEYRLLDKVSTNPWGPRKRTARPCGSSNGAWAADTANMRRWAPRTGPDRRRRLRCPAPVGKTGGRPTDDAALRGPAFSVGPGENGASSQLP